MRTFTLLVVDDESGVREKFAEEFVSNPAIRVLAADSVESALNLILETAVQE